MDYSEIQKKEIINKYIDFVNNLNYDERIKNLLYLIVPAFIIRYKLDNEKLILNTFKEVSIVINDQNDQVVPAFYTCIPFKVDNEIKLVRTITIKNYENNSLVGLLDSLVHEYNHALNSFNNPYTFDDKNLYIRVGLTRLVYDKTSLKAVSKDNSYILEEILNTYQTEQIIDIIYSFKGYSFSNPKLNTALYILDNHIDKKYETDAYQTERFFSEELIKNKTFTSTLSNLRLKGMVDDIEYWFDNITGRKNSYKELIEYIYKLQEYKGKTPKGFFQKRRFKNNIIDLYKNVRFIINTFNNNCTFR